MITHKLPEAQCADMIVVIKDGEAIDQGRHEELLNRCELYHRLWNAYIRQDNIQPSASSTTKMMKAFGERFCPEDSNVTRLKPDTIGTVSSKEIDEECLDSRTWPRL